MILTAVKSGIQKCSLEAVTGVQVGYGEGLDDLVEEVSQIQDTVVREMNELMQRKNK